MKQQHRDALDTAQDNLLSLDTFAACECAVALEQMSTTAPSLSSEPTAHRALPSLSVERNDHHRATVSKNRQKQLQQWAAARSTTPITSSFFSTWHTAGLEPQVSPTRVLLSGLGADELCGGYARYRTAHRRGGDTAARASMQADIDRIWLRNLGRDDR
jgi:asparagine synthetase B (glutamine-hydrolysing)